MTPPTPDHLRIWIVQNGEELPCDPGTPRLLRQGILAGELSKRGHDVTYWAPSFNHQRKVQRPAHPDPHDLGFTVRILPTRAYSRHISPARILSHIQAARSFRQMSAGERPPDVLIAGFPTIELAHAGVTYAAEHQVPSLVDLRDQWPDIIRDPMPTILRRAGAPLLNHWDRLRNEALTRATSVGGITDEFITWGLAAVGRERGPLDKAFHLAPPPGNRQSEEDLETARIAWRGELATTDDNTVVAYAGSLSERTGIATVARAAATLPENVQERLKIVICGAGQAEDEVRSLARTTPALHFAGWRQAPEIRALMEVADYGIIPYRESPDFLMSYPNKLGELLSFGLPILNSLGGITGSLLETSHLQVKFEADDVSDCARALTHLAAHRPDASARDRARRVFAEYFDPNRIYPQYADHVENLARGCDEG